MIKRLPALSYESALTDLSSVSDSSPALSRLALYFMAR
jgi:hypothetical protein